MQLRLNKSGSDARCVRSFFCRSLVLDGMPSSRDREAGGGLGFVTSKLSTLEFEMELALHSSKSACSGASLDCLRAGRRVSQDAVQEPCEEVRGQMPPRNSRSRIELVITWADLWRGVQAHASKEGGSMATAQKKSFFEPYPGGSAEDGLPSRWKRC